MLSHRHERPAAWLPQLCASLVHDEALEKRDGLLTASSVPRSRYAASLETAWDLRLQRKLNVFAPQPSQTEDPVGRLSELGTLMRFGAGLTAFGRLRLMLEEARGTRFEDDLSNLPLEDFFVVANTGCLAISSGGWKFLSGWRICWIRRTRSRWPRTV